MRAIAVWLLALALVLTPAMAGAATNDDGKDATPPAKPEDKPDAKTEAKKTEKAKNDQPAKPSLEEEIAQLKELLAAQSQELTAQRETLKQQQARLEELMKALAAQPKSAAAIPAGAQPAASQPDAVSASAVAAASSGSAPSAAATASAASGAPTSSSANTTMAATTPDPTAATGSSAAPQEDGPASLKFKGITLTPGGFFAAETVWRQRGLAADVNTPFNSIPVSGSSQAHLSEFNASGRQSRISMLAEGKVGNTTLSGYYETDFLGAGTPSNNNQSNSYVLRQRQFWARAALDAGWTFVGGQMWSLITETKHGVDNRTEALPMTIDAQYTIGFSWARQYGFRMYKNFNNKVWLAMSVEGAQTTLTAHGNANNFLIAAPGAGGGLFNNQANYSFNTTPDFVFKAAFEPGFGHYEIFGDVGTVRARIFPCATASVAVPCVVNGTTAPSGVGAFNDERVSGGFGANIRFPIKKKVDLGAHFFGGDGEGRYGTGGLSVATVRPNGTLSLLHSYQALGTAEFHPLSKMDIYLNWGMEYASRAAYLNAAGAAVGYGSPLFTNSGCNVETLPTNQNTPAGPANCTMDTKVLIEGTFGFWYRFYKGTYGTLQWGPQYSYVVRETWPGLSGLAGVGVAPRGTENMVFTSFRYYIP